MAYIAIGANSSTENDHSPLLDGDQFMQCLDDCITFWIYWEIIYVGAYILIEFVLYIDQVPHIRINLDGINPSPLMTSARCLYYAW